VGALLRIVRRRLESDYGDVWIEGEVADLARPRSGHLYFALRDETSDAALRAVMWRSDAQRIRFVLEDGARVRARGNLTIYEARGTFQLRVTRLEEAGQGDLARRFEQIRARLEAQGLLDESRKRPLPVMPRHVGVVTSRDGAALRDILEVLRKAVPTRITLSYCAVQGEGAPAEIEAALDRLAELEGPEVVLVARGGGSGDDLWAWNEERVAQAIARHPVPVISGVGHQVDVTIADLVADRRAATPTEAASIAVPEGAAVTRRLSDLSSRLERAARVGLREQRAELDAVIAAMPPGDRLLDGSRQKVDDLLRVVEGALRSRLAGATRVRGDLDGRLSRVHPQAQLERRRAAVAGLRGRLTRWSSAELPKRRARLGRAAAALNAMSPLEVLSRGYALARRKDGVLVTDAKAVSVGDSLEVTLKQGSLECQVTSASKD